MAAGASRGRPRFAAILGAGATVLAVLVTPASAAAQQQDAPKGGNGNVMAGLNDSQLCAMIQNAMKGNGGGQNKGAANRKAYQKIDVATAERVLMGHIPAFRTAGKGSQGAVAISPERALLGYAPRREAAKNAAAAGSGMQVSVSNGSGQVSRTVTCK